MTTDSPALPGPDAGARRPGFLAFALVGAVGGFMSGLFGVGGGIVIVPLLVLLLGMNQRLAAGTSVASILPTAIVGATTYAIAGNVDWLAGVLLAVGVTGGAQIGSRLLALLPVRTLQWLFAGFLLLAAAGLWFVVPHRDQVMSIDVVTGAVLVVIGVFIGVLTGVLGVGGGVIVVPMLMFFFGASDLVAKGTSLLMMIPGSVSATIGNLKRGNTDLRGAAILGVVASVASPLGAWAANALTPFVANVAFSILIAATVVQMVVKLVRSRPERRPSE